MGSHHSDDREGLDKIIVVDERPDLKMLEEFEKRGAELEGEEKAEGPSKAEVEAKIRKALSGQQAEPAQHRMGATGIFPGGKITGSDQGQLGFKIGHTNDKKKVILDFGKPIAWVGFTPAEAFSISKALRKHAKKCRS